MLKKTATATVAAMMMLGLAACGSDDDSAPAPAPDNPPAPGPAPGPAPAPAPQAVGALIALTTDNRIISFDPGTPGTLAGSATVTGLPSGESLLGIDMRPADGRLYALGSSGTLYVIDPATGAATRQAALAPASGDDAPFAALSGTRFGVDFNPAADRLRVVSDTGQNLRINVDTGATITDGALNGAAGARITAAGYTNAFAGTTTTQLYVLDATTGVRYLQDPPNDGALASPAPLGVAATEINGFDIDARDNTGWAAFGAAGATQLVRINLAATSGAATVVGPIAGGASIVGLALNQAPRLTALGLTADARLLAFDPAAPTTIRSTTAVTGLAGGERLLGIDVRPADGKLYGLTSTARLLTIDPGTGAATPVATLAADQTDATDPFTALAGTRFAVDFNPVADRLRVISGTGQNLRINVATGATITDGTINRASPASIVAGAYTNSFAGTTATTLYDIDATTGVLATQTPPNDGTLVDVGPLGVDASGLVGFDIAGGGNGVALAAFEATPGGPSTLHGIALATGAATLYRNTTANPAASRIGGDAGPGLIDLAIRLENAAR